MDKSKLNEMVSLIPIFRNTQKTVKDIEITIDDDSELEIGYNSDGENINPDMEPEVDIPVENSDSVTININTDDKVKISEAIDPFIIRTYLKSSTKTELVKDGNEDDVEVNIEDDLKIIKDNKEKEDISLPKIDLSEPLKLNEALNNTQRSKLKKEDFGLPDKRKYPIHDEAHVYFAIRMFNHVDAADEAELAGNILKAAKKFGIEVKPGQDNRLIQYTNIKPIKKSKNTKAMNEALSQLINEEKINEPWSKDFYPCYSPKEMLELGVFEGKYLNDDRDEYPADWYKDARIVKDGEPANPELNKFGVKSRQSLQEWKRNGWINPQDPKGWFQWYCRYYMGRRTSDDARQIKRWRSFVARHQAQIKNNCSPSDEDCRAKQRQGLLQWGWDSTKDFNSESVKKANLKKFQSIINESAVVKELTRRPKSIKSNMKIDIDGKEIIPVYIILTKNDTLMGNAIRKVTGEKYNHASIAVNHNLNTFYSFARRDNGTGGLVIESTKEGRMFELMNSDKPTEYSLYVTFLSKPKYIKLETKLNTMVKDFKKYKYNLMQLLKLPLGIENNDERAMICSEFVGKMLREADENLVNKHPSLMTPGDLVNPKFYHLGEGLLKDYNPAQTKLDIEKLVNTNQIFSFLSESVAQVSNFMEYRKFFEMPKNDYVSRVLDKFYPSTMIDFQTLLSMSNGAIYYKSKTEGFEVAKEFYDSDRNIFGVSIKDNDSHVTFAYTIHCLIDELFIKGKLFTNRFNDEEFAKFEELADMWRSRIEFYYSLLSKAKSEENAYRYKQMLFDLGWHTSSNPNDEEVCDNMRTLLMAKMGMMCDPAPESLIDYNKLEYNFSKLDLLDDSLFLTPDKRFPVFNSDSLILAAYAYSSLSDIERENFMERWLFWYEEMNCKFKLLPGLEFTNDLPKDSKALIINMDSNDIINEGIKTKSFNVDLSDDGTLKIKSKLKSDIRTMYEDSLRNIKVYKKSDNLDGLKHEAVVLKYMIDIITNTYANPRVNKKINDPKKYKEMMDLRANMINTWSQTVDYISSRDKNFNFTNYYDQSEYGKDIAITQHELSTSAKLVNAVIKSLAGL